MGRKHDEVLKIAAAAVVAAHEASNNASVDLRDKAQARVALEVSGRRLSGIGIAQRHAWGRAHKSDNGVVIADLHGAEGNVRGAMRIHRSVFFASGNEGDTSIRRRLISPRLGRSMHHYGEDNAFG